jgi:hypothetical protein
MRDGPSQPIVLHNKFRSAYLMEKYVKQMMQVQNQMQKFHFNGKPKCMTPPQNRWLFVMSQISLEQVAFCHVSDLLKCHSTSICRSCEGTHELRREFSINNVTLIVHVPTCIPCLAHEKQSFYLCF